MAQKGLDITGSNLSNANTEGYTRQRLDVYAEYANMRGAYLTKTAKLSLSGQGVFASGVAQTRDAYLDKRFRDTNCYVAEYDQKASIMDEVETVFTNFSDTFDDMGMAVQFDNLKSALRKYAEDGPDREELASVVRNQAYNICKLFNQQHVDLEGLEEQTIYDLHCTLEDANSLIQEIVEYNREIVDDYSILGANLIYNGESVTGGYGPNEMLDARNVLIDRLSELGDIHVENNYDGSVKITMGGVVVVDGQSSTLFVTNSTYEVFRDNYYANRSSMLRFTDGTMADLGSGKIKAYNDMLNGNGPYSSGNGQNTEYGIAYYKRALNEFANAFTTLMNNLNGIEHGEERAMFTSIDGGEINAQNIRISESWLQNATMIAERYNEETGKYDLPVNLDGDAINRLLLGMDDPVVIGEADYYGSCYDFVLFLNNRLAQNIEFSNKQCEMYTETATSLLNSRDATMGVSDTEEGINMLNYSKWFNASSRMLTTLDEALDTIISKMGLVGR
ncbi:MAG: flagellar hook-associated protein FlgK [Ruminiclostridium sp.]|nr:flagellar hook-associated protein FlgK [Ruminiclostridium sp.]